MGLEDRRFLVLNLSFVYRLIVASAPLLRFAIPLAEGELKRYYEQHLEEETDHDVMLRDDLARLGIAEPPRFFSAAELAGSQYYLIAHEHPAALLGYMHVLERNVAGQEVVDVLEEIHGAELTAMRHHAIHDPGHTAELQSQISVLPKELRKLVYWNADNVLRVLRRELNETLR